MTQISNLTQVDSLSGSDSIPVWSVENSSTRRASVDQMCDYSFKKSNPIIDMKYDQDSKIMSIYFFDGTQKIFRFA